MAIEATPVTVFAHRPDPAAVITVLRSMPDLLDLEVDGSPYDWSEAHVTLDDPHGARCVVVRHDPGYWERPAFDEQIAGMQRYLAAAGSEAGSRQDRATTARLDSLSELGFAVSVAADADQREPWLHDDDPAGRLASALALELDGVLFWISGLFDARFRLLLGGRRHPAARPPSWMADPPPPDRVARRLLVLVARHLRAQLEYLDDPAIDREGERGRIVTWIERGGFGAETEPGETSTNVPCGELDPAQADDDWWQVEGAAMLGWALGILPYPPDEPSQVIEQLADTLGWPHGVPPGFIIGSTVRGDDELRTAQDHERDWFSRTGPADRARLDRYHRTAAERYRAVTWLRRGGSYTSTDIGL